MLCQHEDVDTCDITHLCRIF